MTSTFLSEHGPEAAATRARFRDVQVAFRGEGGSVVLGQDGPTFCVFTHDGTALDMLADGEVSELDWRRASTIRRFATIGDRDMFLATQPWHLPAQAVDERHPAAQPPLARGHFELRLYAGMTNSEVSVKIGVRDGRLAALCAIAVDERPEVRFDVDVPPDEWARFEAELRLLDVSRWRDFGTRAMDGLMWSMTYELAGRRIAAGGSNAYPPDGDGTDPTAEFVRLLLAVGRLVGRQLWDGFDVRGALTAIPDERDRVEHLLLGAVRAWADDFEAGGGDPASLTETRFEQALLPYVTQLTAARSQVDVNGRMPQGWPQVGKLDLELTAPNPAAWVELKWAKTANTLHNCLWDAGKVAQAQRERAASHGYLLAGAPVRQWQSSRAPTSLFGVSCHEAESLVDDYPSWWQAWFTENQNTYPHKLPTPVVTMPVGQIRCAPPGREPWLITLARVEAPGYVDYTPAPRPSADFPSE